jgi:Dolichyl-phosphate-mannose-protein mannosyltransferase
MPSTTWQQPSATGEPTLPPHRHAELASRSMLHPLTVICAVQAILSLTLIWSNTAFRDEANNLWIGELEVEHWLQGTTWPSSYADRIFSGSPIIYPPLGALADSVGGLVAARILSLIFMLVATVLLYLTASRLIGRIGAVVATALWALSEPAISLAFATFDPLSVLLTAVSAWLVVQAGCRRRRGALVAAAAAALALANATAYSGVVIDPIVIIFAFLVWQPRMRALQASLYTACFTVCTVAFFGLLVTSSRSWAALVYTVLNRSVSDHQSIQLVLNDSWGYSGLVISLAVVGALTAIAAEGRQRAALLVLLGCAALVVPAAQVLDQTAWSLDEHLAYGIWFAAIAAGYACSKLIRWLPRTNRQVAAICCVVALGLPAANAWESAWQAYHLWPNARSFISALTPIAARDHGLIYTAGQDNIAEYYTPQGRDWVLWNTALSLNPAGVARQRMESYYSQQLRRDHYGVIALFYSTTFSSAPLPGGLLLSPTSSQTIAALLGVVGDSAGEPGLPALTLALEGNPDYHLVTVGPYSSAHDYSVYAIWQRVQS